MSTSERGYGIVVVRAGSMLDRRKLRQLISDPSNCVDVQGDELHGLCKSHLLTSIKFTGIRLSRLFYRSPEELAAALFLAKLEAL